MAIQGHATAWPLLAAVRTAVFALLVWLGAGTAWADDVVTIGGTGAALGVVRLLLQGGDTVMSQYPARVLRSIGSGGAVKALAVGRVDIGLSQRPLKPEEQGEAACLPFMASVAAFVTSDATLSGATLEQADLVRLMAGEQSFRGRQIQPILRPDADADNVLLTKLVPELSAVMERSRARSGALVAASHQEALEWAEKVAGSLALASIDSVRTEQRVVYFLHFKGENPQTIPFDRPHPLLRTYFLLFRPDARPAVRAWVEFMRGPQAAAILARTGAAPVTGSVGNGC